MLAVNGYAFARHEQLLLVTLNELHGQGRYHNERDVRLMLYALFRLRVDVSPVLLR